MRTENSPLLQLSCVYILYSTIMMRLAFISVDLRVRPTPNEALNLKPSLCLH